MHLRGRHPIEPMVTERSMHHEGIELPHRRTWIEIKNKRRAAIHLFEQQSQIVFGGNGRIPAHLALQANAAVDLKARPGVRSEVFDRARPFPRHAAPEGVRIDSIGTEHVVRIHDHTERREAE